MKKFKNYLMALVGLGAAGSLLLTKAVHAAADTDFSSSSNVLFSSFTDNKGTVWLIIATVVGISLVLGLGIRALLFGKREIISSVPGGSKKRR